MKLRHRVFSAVSHNVPIVDGSGDWNEKCCKVVVRCKQHGDKLIVLTERKRKDSFEHRAKNQKAVFQLAHETMIMASINLFVHRGFSVLGV